MSRTRPFALVQRAVRHEADGTSTHIHRFTTKHENDPDIRYEHHIRCTLVVLETEWTASLCGERVTVKNDGVQAPTVPLPSNTCAVCADRFEFVMNGNPTEATIRRRLGLPKQRKKK